MATGGALFRGYRIMWAVPAVGLKQLKVEHNVSLSLRVVVQGHCVTLSLAVTCWGWNLTPQ